MNLLRVLLRSVCGSHPSDVPPKSKISVQIEKSGNGRRSGAFLHISFKNSSIYKAFGVRQRPPQGAEFVCVPCGANNSKSVAGNSVRVRPPPPAPKNEAAPVQGAVLFFAICRSGVEPIRHPAPGTKRSSCGSIYCADGDDFTQGQRVKTFLPPTHPCINPGCRISGSRDLCGYSAE